MFAYPPYKLSRVAVRGIERRFTAIHCGFFSIAWAVGASAQTPVSVNLAWDPSVDTNIAGYHLHQGTASQTYTNLIDVRNVTNATISGLTPGITYYFAVSAYDTAGLESTLSNEISYTPSVSTNSSPPVVLLTAPSNGAAYVAPASITLAASVTPSGHTINQVQFHNGAPLLGSSANAGVMIRESLTPGSRYALMSLSSGDTYLWQRRSKTGFKTWSNSAGSRTPPQSWVRVVRNGSFFTGYGSSDGVNWTQVSSANISMATNIYVGLAVASGTTYGLTTSSFGGLNVVP